MQTSSLRTRILPPPFPSNQTRLPASFPIRATRRDGSSEEKRHGRKLVDENMIVLKMRIQEVMEKEQDNRVATSCPGGWMGWEKEWYRNYESDVCELVGLMQNLVMNARPSLVVGVVALLMFSVSTSFVVVLSYLLGMLM